MSIWELLSRINSIVGVGADRVGLTRLRVRGWTIMSLGHAIIRALIFSPYLKWRKKTIVHGFSLCLGNWKQLMPGYLTESYEQTLLHFEQLIQGGMTVVDLGAHIGWYTLHAARAVGDNGRVYAFEPDPMNLETLNMNIVENQYQGRVRIVPMAVSNRRKVVKLLTGASSTAGSSLYGTRDAGEVSVDVEAVSLDEFFAQEGWPSIDIVKMDIEGAEKTALEGMIELVHRNRQLKLIMELDPGKLRAAGVSPIELFDVLEDRGFRKYSMASRGLEILRIPEDLPRLLHHCVGGAIDLLCESG